MIPELLIIPPLLLNILEISRVDPDVTSKLEDKSIANAIEHVIDSEPSPI